LDGASSTLNDALRNLENRLSSTAKKRRQMKSKQLIYILASAVLSIFSNANAAETDGFTSIFNGKDLASWKMGPDKSWVVKNGVIALSRQQYDGKEHNSDYLWFDEQLGNFILEVEVKMPEQANSGIYLRTSNTQNPVPTGIEVQVANSFGRSTLSKTGTAGAIYDCLAPTENPLKAPGEWNLYRITCQNEKIVVELNGKKIIDMNLNQWNEPNKNPDGTKNKFNTAMKDFARQGFIGFQDHGRPVEYRNIRLKKLQK